MSIPIRDTMSRIPGGLLLVPLLLGAVINTFAPNAGDFFGSFTGGFFVGLPAIFAVFFLALGSTLEVRSTPQIIKKGGALLGAKVVLAAIVGIILGQILGEAPVAGGIFAGLSVLAVVAAMNDTNGGLFISLMSQYGRKKDAGALSIMSIESGPFLTMVTLGLAGLSAFPWQTLLGAILPLLIGIILGNLDKGMRELLAPLVPSLIPFIGLGIGLTISLETVVQAGPLGIALGFFVFFVGGTVLFIADKLTGGNGLAGIAAATTAGNAALVPAIIAEANPVYADAAPAATVLVAASVVVTSVLCPIGTAFWAKRLRAAGKPVGEEPENEPDTTDQNDELPTDEAAEIQEQNADTAGDNVTTDRQGR